MKVILSSDFFPSEKDEAIKEEVARRLAGVDEPRVVARLHSTAVRGVVGVLARTSEPKKFCRFFVETKTGRVIEPEEFFSL